MEHGVPAVDAEDERLRREVAMLRAELASVVSEYDDLVHHTRVNLNARYMLEVGNLELRLHGLICSAMRIRRRIELVRARLNRGESPNIEAIDRQLDREMAAYEQDLERLTRELNRALDLSNGTPLTAVEVRELKDLYHSVVKSLHPDVNPDATPAMLDLYNRAVRAYEDCDLDAMRVIASSLGREPAFPQTRDGLEEERDRILSRIADVRRRMRSVKESHPFDKRAMLDDPDAVERRRQEIRRDIGITETEIGILRREMEGLL